MSFLINPNIPDSSSSISTKYPPSYASLPRASNFLRDSSDQYSSSSPDQYLLSPPTDRSSSSTTSNGFLALGSKLQPLLLQRYHQEQSKYLPESNERYIASVEQSLSSISSVSSSRYLPSPLLTSTYQQMNNMNGAREYPLVSRDYDNLNSDHVNKGYPGTLSRNFLSSRVNDFIGRDLNTPSTREFSPISKNFTPVNGRGDYDNHKTIQVLPENLRKT